MKYICLVLLPLLACHAAHSQDSTSHDAKQWPILAGSAAVLGASFILLDKAWYDGYERSSFHFFNDGEEWLQMDKAGHVFTSYTIGRYGHDAYSWAGLSRKQSIWVGGSLGLAYASVIELLDGTSAQWGFSNWDMAANLVGTGLFIGQQLAWDEQRILVKYSAHTTEYAPRRPEVLGSGLAEELFKDYNGQTYWLSFSPWHANSGSAFADGGLLCVSIGYGATGMLSALDNRELDILNNEDRYRSFYLSLDLDLTKIRTRSKFLRTVFNVLNGVKIPAPTLEFSENGDITTRGFYF